MVVNISSGKYSHVEVDIMDKLVTFTAVARGLTLSAAADNPIRAEIEKTTPHLLVQDAGNNRIYAFHDFANPSLCFCMDLVASTNMSQIYKTFIDK